MLPPQTHTPLLSTPPTTVSATVDYQLITPSVGGGGQRLSDKWPWMAGAGEQLTWSGLHVLAEGLELCLPDR